MSLHQPSSGLQSAPVGAGQRCRSACRGRGGVWAVLWLVALGGAAGGEVGFAPPPLDPLGVDELHAAGVTGRGVTVAVVLGQPVVPHEVGYAADGHARLLAVGAVLPAAEGPRLAAPDGGDALLEVMLSSRRRPDGGFAGVAPNADLVLVRALGPDGGRLEDVARAVDWVVARSERYGIRVLDLALVAGPSPPTGEDLLGRALARAWEAGIVVVAPAGDAGPRPATVAAPGGLPAVITVGAAIVGPRGVAVAPYSSTGPARSGRFKPEIVAPAAPGPAAPPVAETGAIRRPEAGTAVASSTVSGIVALLLEADPWLTPDQVRQRLLATARPLPAAGDVHPVLRQGAGLVDAWAAVRGGGPPAAAHAARGLARDDGAGEGYSWSAGAARGWTWSDEAARGWTWSDEAARGWTWSDRAVRGWTWSDRSWRGLVWSD